MTIPRTTRMLCTALAAQMLLAACASAQPQATWPDPQPQPEPWRPQPVVRATPNFQAPSATHCSRPVSLHETPGRSPQDEDALLRRERHAADATAKSAPSFAPAPAPVAPPSVASRGPEAAARAGASRGHAGAPRERAIADAAAAPSHPPFQPQPQTMQRPHTSPVVTAGVVDDNADFSAYLQFRQRTRVEHRPRAIRERHLLEVKDSRGRGIADAEVAVQGTSGHAMWARTDAAGRVWLHPNAFDPAHSPAYDIAVRKDGRHAIAHLVRGQRSAVEVRLDASAAPARARLDLVFMIDATGSMGDEIDKLKATLRTITSDLARLPSRPDLCLGLVAYRDRGDAFLVRSHDFTDDVGAFLQGALYPLRAGGGGDYPEAMNEALHETVHRMSWRGTGATRMVILLADAPPHLDYGAPHYDEDMQAALGKGIKVFSVGASGLDKQGEVIQRQIAQYTGGRFVFLTYGNAHDPTSGPGRETVHDVKNYSVDTLDRLIVRLVTEELGKLATGG